MRTTIEEVTPERLDELIRGDGVRVVDVREPAEHAREHLPGAELAPAGRGVPTDGRTAVFYCRTGQRSRAVAERAARKDRRVHHLAGGIEAWKKAGKPVVVAPDAPMAIMRQVQVVAGSFVVLGVALGFFVSAWWLALSAFVGCGLMFAGLTGWCGMAKLLARMPWNRASGRDQTRASDSSAGDGRSRHPAEPAS
jgi:rhodanese-related sulfurtransferase